MIYTYPLWGLLQLETLEMVYYRALTDLRDKVAQGHGSVAPPMFGSFQAPIRLAWRADIYGGGLNYSMLLVAFEALRELHTDPAPRLRGIYRKMIYYDIVEQRGAQRVELGDGQVESTGTISERRSVNPLQADYAYQIPATPYSIIIIATSGTTMRISPLFEAYTRLISSIATQIAEGHGATMPEEVTVNEPPIVLNWVRSTQEIGLNYTDLRIVLMWLAFHHTEYSTPWFQKTIRYHIVLRGEEQQPLVAMGGGWVGDLLEIESSNVSVQSSKRDSVKPVNLSGSYTLQLPNTDYLLIMSTHSRGDKSPLPLIALIAAYDAALHSFEGQIQSGHGGDVPATYNVEMWGVALGWRREHPPGLNYTMLERVYRLLKTLQTEESTSFPGGYRQRAFFSMMTRSNVFLGFGTVRGLSLLDLAGNSSNLTSHIV